MMSAKSRDEVWDEWQQLVNMPPTELEEWLDTDESKSVGDSEMQAVFQAGIKISICCNASVKKMATVEFPTSM